MSNGAIYQSATAAITSGNNTYGTPVVVVSSAPFLARKVMVCWNTSGVAAGALQISIGSDIVVPFFPASSAPQFTPSPLTLDLLVPQGSSISIAAASYNTTQSYNVSLVLFSEGNDDLIGDSIISPGVSLSNAYFQISSAGANVWTPLGGALTRRIKNIKLPYNSTGDAFNMSLGYGTSSPPGTVLLDAVPVGNNTSYTWNMIEFVYKIPAGQTLYAMQSIAKGAYWPLLTQ